MPEETDAEYQARLAREWGTYVAVGYIHYDGVLIAKPGDAIPITNVEQHGYLEAGLVAKTTTKAAKAVTEKGSV
jgi:hypothetical protein